MRAARRLAAILLPAAALLCAGCSARRPPSSASQAPEGPRRPDLVVVLSDDQRWDTLGVAGHPFIRTPHIDRLAREGALFENMFVITPLCSPSRATVLSGLYPYRHGVSRNGLDLDYEDLDTVAELLQEGGYVTAFFGKYHLRSDRDGPRPGFDHWAAFAYPFSEDRYEDVDLNVNGERVATRGHSTDVLADMAARWIEERDDRPFFLMLSLFSAHTPFRPLPRHEGLYAGTPVPLPESLGDDLARFPSKVRGTPIGARERRVFQGIGERADPEQEFVRRYARMIPGIDDAVGRLREALAAAGRLDGTAFLFSSDNGYMLGEHGIFRKGLPYDPAIRVPLVIRYPALIPPGQRRAEPSLNVDLAPTLLELAGLPGPSWMQGRSLVPLLRDASPPWREAWLSMSSFQPGGRPYFVSVRTGRWKYVRSLAGPGFDELFDLESDPGERRNLALEPGHEEELLRLRNLLLRRLEETGAPPKWRDLILR